MGTSVHCRSPMLETEETVVVTRLKLILILEESKLNLTQRYLGFLDVLYVCFCYFLLFVFFVIF